jgi:hypothetical protein
LFWFFVFIFVAVAVVVLILGEYAGRDEVLVSAGEDDLDDAAALWHGDELLLGCEERLGDKSFEDGSGPYVNR